MEIKKHPHATNMLLYATDSFLTDVPHVWWEVFSPELSQWVNLNTNPRWLPEVQYRRKFNAPRIVLSED